VSEPLAADDTAASGMPVRSRRCKACRIAPAIRSGSASLRWPVNPTKSQGRNIKEYAKQKRSGVAMQKSRHKTRLQVPSGNLDQRMVSD
jgi:hypothetical protein